MKLREDQDRKIPEDSSDVRSKRSNLSVGDPMNVIRRQLKLEIARKKDNKRNMKYKQQIEKNKARMRKVGKRSTAH